MNNNFQNNLKKLAGRFSQKYIAEKTGFSQSSINNYLTKNSEPSIQFLVALKDAFGICVDDFLFSDYVSENYVSYEKFLGNYRVAPCSHILKQKTARDYIFSHYEPKDTVLYLGLDWSETHRFASPRRNWQPFRVEYPMGDAPYMSKSDMLEVLKADGLEVPRMYKMGFAHNNCGGFCCRAGQGHFAKLYEHFPNRFAHAEAVEEGMRQALGKDISYMKRSVNGITRPYTLKQLRSDIEARREIDLFDIGGCGCFVEGD